MPGIDPASITQETIPAVLGAILIEIRDVKAEQIAIKKVLDEHTECLAIFKFSTCVVMPWIGRNRWVLVSIVGGVSIYLSSLDWLNRWLQWSFLPPRTGP
jgi:hypothetical protein